MTESDVEMSDNNNFMLGLSAKLKITESLVYLVNYGSLSTVAHLQSDRFQKRNH